jgi:phage terminase large subunit-like protein
MNEPCKEFERLILSGSINHGGNPVMRWMVGNVAIKTDPSGNIRPVKPDNKSAKKIDGVVTNVMAIAGNMFQKVEEASIYETRGLIDL